MNHTKEYLTYIKKELRLVLKQVIDLSISKINLVTSVFRRGKVSMYEKKRPSFIENVSRLFKHKKELNSPEKSNSPLLQRLLSSQ
jgi:hypothetical protein